MSNSKDRADNYEMVAYLFAMKWAAFQMVQYATVYGPWGVDLKLSEKVASKLMDDYGIECQELVPNLAWEQVNLILAKKYHDAKEQP